MITVSTQAADRKEMVKKLAGFLDTPAVYKGVPTYAYQIGELTVNRDGSITGEREALIPVAQFLHAHGYITTEYTELDDGRPQQEAPNDPETAQPEPADPGAPDHTCISFPLSDFTPQALTNLLRMLYSRQHLIREMTRSDTPVLDEEIVSRLKDETPDTTEAIAQIVQDSAALDMAQGIEIADGTLSIVFPYDPADPTAWTHYAKLIRAMADKAKQARHVHAELLHPADNEMKYFAHCWLMQLGLGGEEHRALRSALIDHLHGYAAFRTPDKMQKHQVKQAAIRRQKREAAHQAGRTTTGNEEEAE